MSSHRDRIVDQFTRQAVPFSTAPGIRDEAALQLLVEASGAGPDDTVLDVACGPGLVVSAFARVVRHATGIDVTPAMLERARAVAVEAGVTNVTLEAGRGPAAAVSRRRLLHRGVAVRLPPLRAAGGGDRGDASRVPAGRPRRGLRPHGVGRPAEGGALPRDRVSCATRPMSVRSRSPSWQRSSRLPAFPRRRRRSTGCRSSSRGSSSARSRAPRTSSASGRPTPPRWQTTASGSARGWSAARCAPPTR